MKAGLQWPPPIFTSRLQIINRDQLEPLRGGGGEGVGSWVLQEGPIWPRQLRSKPNEVNKLVLNFEAMLQLQ